MSLPRSGYFPSVRSDPLRNCWNKGSLEARTLEVSSSRPKAWVPSESGGCEATWMRRSEEKTPFYILRKRVREKDN